jgi:hypothetical protein
VSKVTLSVMQRRDIGRRSGTGGGGGQRERLDEVRVRERAHLTLRRCARAPRLPHNTIITLHFFSFLFITLTFLLGCMCYTLKFINAGDINWKNPFLLFILLIRWKSDVYFLSNQKNLRFLRHRIPFSMPNNFQI